MVSDRMKVAYNRVASQYDERNGTMNPVLEAFATSFMTELPAHPSILDAGCGTGRDMAWFEQNGCTVTGIDLSSEMLALARTRTTGVLLEMDLLELNFESDSFEGIWTNASLLHIPKARTADILSQFRNLLKTNGILALGLQKGDFEGWESGVYADTERYFSRFTEIEIETLLTASGFVVKSLETREGGPRTWIHILAERSR